MYKSTTLIIILSFFLSNEIMAIQEIIKPDTSVSKQIVVEKQKELLKELNESLGKGDNIKLGSIYGKIAMFYHSHEFDESAKICYENAIEVSPYDYRWHHLYAFVESTLGNFDNAVESYRKVLKINPEYLASKIRWAELEMQRGEFEEAIRLYNEVLAIAPGFAKAYIGLGTINLQSGKPQDAIKKYKKALELQPQALQVNYLLSQAYASVGDEKNAKLFLSKKGNKEVVMYDKVLQEMHMHSVSSSYYAQAGIHAFMNADYKFAEQLVNHAIELDPIDVNIKLILLNIYLSTKKIDKALKYSKNLTLKYPDNYRVAYSMGMLYEITGDDDKAIKWFLTELKINPINKSTHILLAKAYIRKKQYKKALIKLREAKKLEGESVYAIYTEAVILSHLKMCDKSIPLFYEAISKRPKSFTYLTSFVKTVAICSVKDEKIKTDALNAARNMYRSSPTIKVTQALAMIEAAVNNKESAVDYQRQVIFQALSISLKKEVMDDLKSDLERYKQGKIATNAIKFYDVDINPARSIDLYQ